MKTHNELRSLLMEITLDGKRLPASLVNDVLGFAMGGIEPYPTSLMQATPVNQSNDKMVESGFKFGPRSRAELGGVLPVMVEVAELALRLSTQDFMIFDGLRTAEEQQVLVAKGASKTLNSKHLKQKDGFSYAFDAVPVVGSIPKWDWELIWPVAYAVDQAATKLGCAHRIRWGGAWDRTLADFGGDPGAYKRETELYASRHPGKDFLDGPHFEWVS